MPVAAAEHNYYGLPTKSLFKAWTDAGVFARRSDTIKALDDLLDRFPTLKTEFLRGLAAFQVVELCDEYIETLTRENRRSRRLVGVTELRRMASRLYLQLLPAIRAKVQFKPANPTGADRARQNFKKLMHNPKFKALGELHDRGDRLDAKQLEDSMMLEALDDLHRDGRGLKGIYNVWKNDQSTQKNFWDYLEEYLIKNPTDAPYRVKYLQENERRAFRLEVCGGKIFQGEQAERRSFSTKNLAVNSTKPNRSWGRAIYVVSLDNEIYSGGSFSNPTPTADGTGVVPSRNQDIYHHSSFLMGKPVLCAGEIIVDGGVLLTINPQSGHYRPSVTRFQMFLHQLKRKGIALNRTTVEWEVGGVPCYYNAQEFADAKQVTYNNAPCHNGMPLRELQTMREPNCYKGALMPIRAPQRAANSPVLRPMQRPTAPGQSNAQPSAARSVHWAPVQTGNGFRNR